MSSQPQNRSNDSFKNSYGSILYSTIFFSVVGVGIAYWIINVQYNEKMYFPPSGDPITHRIKYSLLLYLITAIILLFSLVIICWKNYAIPQSLIAFTVLLVTLVFISTILWNERGFNASSEFYEDEMLKQIQMFKQNDSAKSVSPWFDEMQLQMKCCGYSGSEDYRNKFKPASCCGVSAFKETAKGNSFSEYACVVALELKDSNGLPINQVYYTKGCKEPAQQQVVKYRWFFLLTSLVGIVMMIVLIVFIELYKCFNKNPNIIQEV